jgi:hypothetical protein
MWRWRAGLRIRDIDRCVREAHAATADAPALMHLFARCALRIANAPPR